MYSSRPFPLAVSHRGLRLDAPENSIPAFLAAIEAGAEAIELDVHATADGVVVIHHDPVIQLRSAEDVVTTRSILEMTGKEIEGARLSGDVAMPTLDDTLEAIGTRAGVFIEIKARGIENDVVRCLRRHDAGMDRWAVHAFDHRIAKRVLELLPSVRTGILQVSYPVDS
jgi:glycerophosphoryl diester phosphodiesterase